jgi:hypothetical protein
MAQVHKVENGRFNEALVIHYQDGNINDIEMGAACRTHNREESALIFF